MKKKYSYIDTPIDQLKEISSWISSVQDIDQLLELIIESAAKMINAKAGSLLLLNQKTNLLYFKVATGDKKNEIKNYKVKIGQGIAGHVAQTGKSLLIPDVKKDKRWYKVISESIGFETRSIACVPLEVQQKIIGVVQIIDKNDGSPIEVEDMKLLGEFAKLAALALGRATKFKQVTSENRALKEELGIKHQMIGKSTKLDKVISDGYKVANSKASTLILGESGTGKELLARLIHNAGPRKNKPMIALNCAALPESLLEDELFGHEKGSFTGAISRKIGKFELADEGTIFLDEIGEMNPGMQAKLLRVLQEGIFYRVGGNDPIQVDVRIIAATNKNLAEEVEEKRFREDLYYRLNVVQMDMPPLRERRDDIPLLAEHFLDFFKKETGLVNLTISQKAMDKMVSYSWPGNIRELRNAIERSVVMGNGNEVLPEDLPISTARPGMPCFQVGLTLEDAINTFKKEFIILNLQNTQGNRSKAAKIMSIQRTYLSRLISKYDLREI